MRAARLFGKKEAGRVRLARERVGHLPRVGEKQAEAGEQEQHVDEHVSGARHPCQAEIPHAERLQQVVRDQVLQPGLLPQVKAMTIRIA